MSILTKLKAVADALEQRTLKLVRKSKKDEPTPARGITFSEALKPAEPVAPVATEKPTPEQPRLSVIHPERVLSEGTLREMDDVREFAGQYEPGEIKNLFQKIGDELVAIWNEEYLPGASAVLKTALNVVRKATAAREAAVVDITTENTGLLAAAKKAVLAQMSKLETAKVALAKAQRELRRVVIGLTGTPDGTVSSSNMDQDLWQTAAAFTVALGLDLAFNMGLLRSQTNREEAIAFSFAVSIFGSLAALWSARYLKIWLAQHEAVQKRDECFHGEKDPETGHAAEVFAIAPQTKFMLILSHSLFLFIILGTPIYRASLSHGLGWLAGSIGFGIVLVGFYAYKLIYGTVEHPRISEHTAKKKEVEEREADVKDLENFNINADVRSAFTDCNDDIAKKQGARAVAVEVQLETKDTLLGFVEELKRAPAWFVQEFDYMVAGLVEAIDPRPIETDSELQDASDATTPTFSITLFGFDLDEVMEEVGKIEYETSVELVGRVNNLSEVVKLATTAIEDDKKSEAATRIAREAAERDEEVRRLEARRMELETQAAALAAQREENARLERERAERRASEKPAWVPRRRRGDRS